MKENQTFREGLRGCFISLACIFLAMGAVIMSAKYVYPQNPYCGDMVGAGFPLMFICDNWGGGSPTSSWGKIDFFVDFFNGGLIPGGFLIDLIFYIILIGFIWFAASSIIQKGLNRRNLWWTIFISMGFIMGLLCTFLMILPGYLTYIRPPLFNRTATPIFVPSPTGTLPTAAPTITITPSATSSP